MGKADLNIGVTGYTSNLSKIQSLDVLAAFMLAAGYEATRSADEPSCRSRDRVFDQSPLPQGIRRIQFAVDSEDPHFQNPEFGALLIRFAWQLLERPRFFRRRWVYAPTLINTFPLVQSSSQPTGTHLFL